MLGRVLGKGGDGTIYELNGTEEPYVVKYVQPKIDGIENFLEYFILLYADHPHLMKAKEIEVNDHSLVKILQERAIGDLGQTKVSNKKRILSQLVDAVSYMSAKGIIHGDIKPSNVLVMDKDTVKLNDFSLSRFVVSKSTRKIYTSRYRAPEVLLGKTSLKSDVYALGCTMYEVYTGTTYNHLAFKFSPRKSLFQDLIHHMTLVDHTERYSIEDVKNHSFFHGIKFPTHSYQEIDIVAHLKARWPWCDRAVFIQKCMHEPILPGVDHRALDRRVCDVLKFRLMDTF